MDIFTEEETAFLSQPQLGRLATADLSRQPHVVPVSYHFDPESETIAIGGHHFANSKKARDVHANPRVAIVVDDLRSRNPWRPRGIEIRGTAEYVESGGDVRGPGFDAAWLRITPHRIISWGFGPDGQTSSRRSITANADTSIDSVMSTTS
ncbi:MAG TPA: PPOX class F420-dependent oxidoreductase [Thermomicrobiales bacterium]|nr:PPOX class F420-dependent oxidoreductase [Thermomicrobiales bacterium]